MGWEKRVFKKQKTVWAKTQDDDDSYDLNHRGFVPIKYDNSENAKLYSAHASNLTAWTEKNEKNEKSKKSKKSKKSGIKSLKAPLEYDELVWKAPGKLVTTTETHLALGASTPDANTLDIYTDGACKKNPGPCGSGVAVVNHNNITCLSQYIGIGTNNIAELFAIKIALDTSPLDTKLHIHSDSSYAIGVVSKGWKAKVNTELILSIRSRIKEFKIKPKFIKVKGHSGIPLNELADQLATASVETKIKTKNKK